MGEADLKHLIAHELAHVYDDLLNKEHHRERLMRFPGVKDKDTKKPRYRDLVTILCHQGTPSDVLERSADRLAEEWGFPRPDAAR